MGPAAAYAAVAQDEDDLSNPTANDSDGPGFGLANALALGRHGFGHDDTRNTTNTHTIPVTPSSASTSSTTTTTTTPILSLADQSFTPLSQFDDTFRSDPTATEPAAGQRSFNVSGSGGSKPVAGPAAAPSRANANMSAKGEAVDKRKHYNSTNARAGAADLISPIVVRYAHGGAAAQGHAQHELLPLAHLTGAQASPAQTSSIATPSNDTKSTTSVSPSTDFPPLRTGSVQPDTKLARPTPIVRTTSNAGRLALQHPVPDLNTRSGAYAGNIAQLEATAERLSMTSSIDDAIRDLHGELKRSDSRRSSTLARTASHTDEPTSAIGLHRHLSNASSIINTNTAARHGGYSPAAFIMSPTHSFTSRLRSGSKGSTGRPEIDVESSMSRHGPGKASVRSVMSTKMSLAEISESEPMSLDQHAFDEADAAPPIQENEDGRLPLPPQDEDIPNTDAFHKMLDSSFVEPMGEKSRQHEKPGERPASSRSNHTFQSGLDPFVDFDGVHWEPTEEDVYVPVPSMLEPEPPAPQAHPVRRERPQSYFDPESGQQMLYYPARVPAMLNLPRKLGNKPKAAQRAQRTSQVLSAMVDVNRQSVMPDLNEPAPETRRKPRDSTRDSWLPDPLAGHRESFAALSTFDPLEGTDAREEEHVSQTGPPAEASESLRRPQRLSRTAPDNRKSRMDNLPSQLRASAFFDMPSEAPKIKVQDGSAMATLESILDASAHAPVGAFTDHSFGAKLGTEVYGKEKKRKSQDPAAALHPISPGQEPKKRSSFMWLNKRGSHNSEEKSGHQSAQSVSALGPVNNDVDYAESQALADSIDGESVLHHEQQPSEHESVDENAYMGPPTTLLAELQLRKQQQKQRTQPLAQTFPNGMHATLLEMDAVAETQRKDRKSKRVNLAWEDPDAHLEQNGSDDEDVPLAIIAAKHQGAMNVVDLERPIGLMEVRDMEENEPLSRRRARLQGLEVTPLTHHRRKSQIALTAPTRMGARTPVSRPISQMDMSPESEIEGETLAERKRRLAAMEEAELPKARPVSSSFSAELLSHFGDLDEVKDRKATPQQDVEEETLGQRRRRLQAEREAREREMSYGNLVGRPAPKVERRLSMADILAAHPKKDPPREQGQRIPVPNVGGFRGGVYNDGTGGITAAQSTPAGHSQGMLSPRGQGQGANRFAPQQYGVPEGYNAMGQYSGAPMSSYGAGQYGAGAMSQYSTPMGVYPQPMQVSMPVPGASMDRVERWRRSVQP